MSEEDAKMHGGSDSPAALSGCSSLPVNDDMLREILLRLPPQPSSLPRASAVCKRWLGVATDPKFTRRFRAHHRKPPVLGFFHRSSKGFTFTPILDPPNRIPTHLRRYSGYDVLGCRHGRVLAMDRDQTEFLVFDPITGEQHHVDIPPEFRRGYVNGAVLCAAADQGHVHGGCHSSPFKVVLMTMHKEDNRPITCVYSSETGIWGDLISTAAPCEIDDAGFPATLVGNALYWLQLQMDNDILVFDLDELSLAVISGPPITNFYRNSGRIIQGEDGAVGFAILSYPRFEMWQRNVNCKGVATWVLWKTIEMNNIPGLPPRSDDLQTILGYSEDTDAIFIYVDHTIHMVQLKLMQSKRLPLIHLPFTYHPFTSFYTPGTAIAGGFNGAEMLHMG